MKAKAAILVLLALLLIPQIAQAEKVWQQLSYGISDLDIRSVSIFPENNDYICTASSKHVYFSQDAGLSWRVILSFAAQETEINFLCFPPSTAKILYVATTDGLYVTRNQGRHWSKLFEKIRQSANKINWIALDYLQPKKIYIGTGEGLFFSANSGKSWKKTNGGLTESAVRSIAVHPANSSVLYLANQLGLYKSIDNAVSWSRIYATSLKAADEQEEGEEESSAEENQSLINCIAIDKGNPRRVFVATGLGVFASADSGQTWNRLPLSGLGSDDVNFILTDEKEGALYAATESGVFEYLTDAHRWQELYQGMSARNVYILALNSLENQLYAGTEDGFFGTTNLNHVQDQRQAGEPELIRSEKTDLPEKEGPLQLLEQISLSEPTVQEVQQAALRYADVIHPDRIKALRRNARLKALLPTVSLDYDKTVSVSTNPNYKERVVGPRDWGLTLSWDIGDLVFSEQIRLIDSTTRLMVQLRDDLLDEVTRFYYERRRLQTELVTSAPESTTDYLTMQLRLEELTANIDGLTGGWFSRQLLAKQNSEN